MLRDPSNWSLAYCEPRLIPLLGPHRQRGRGLPAYDCHLRGSNQPSGSRPYVAIKILDHRRILTNVVSIGYRLLTALPLGEPLFLCLLIWISSKSELCATC